eukprot:Protomagalhaensia_sp_Gyna_25__2169@NODE_217_length_4339_cov_94_141163_g169_i0_p1_GENE_NODE_217_length_4339_cov_94_141163_g169_i0NODE_217_length_4339_cov_94_141163_g169_i0_p1_ORF_typecomplete_len325_score51_34UQ_con/PF00179_26/1_2e11ProkE2_B/PF14461_6/0_043UEV/PF05743_13/0_24_NODE_217_length_4339_cov_94_141163_g169_i02891263
MTSLDHQIHRLRVQAKIATHGTQVAFPVKHEILHQAKHLNESSEKPSSHRPAGSILQTTESIYFSPRLSSPPFLEYQIMIGRAKRFTHLQLTLLLEFCMVCDWVIDDCVVLGDWDLQQDVIEWRCLIYPSIGVYEGQRIKFKLVFPSAYPNEMPECEFVDSIPNHPYIDKVSGRLDLGVGFSEWDPDKNCTVQVLAFIRRIFRDKEYLLPAEINETVKQSDFVELASKEGLEAAATQHTDSSHTAADPVFLQLFQDTRPGADDVELRHIQKAVEAVCDKVLTVTGGMSEAISGVHFQHSELTIIREEADRIADSIVTALIECTP